jgi:hypothetical protein
MTDGPIMDAVQALLDEIAKHEDHWWEKVGRCVYCRDCNQRLYQGTIPPDHTKVVTATPSRAPRATQEMRARWGKDGFR